MAHFTTDENMRFIHLYKYHELLWNPHSENNKNRSERDAAYADILARMKKVGMTKFDVRNKIKNLRSMYYQELKKINISKMGGSRNVYKPKLIWFELLHSFVGTVITNPAMTAVSTSFNNDYIIDLDPPVPPVSNSDMHSTSASSSALQERIAIPSEPSSPITNGIKIQTPEQLNKSLNRKHVKKKRKCEVDIPRVLQKLDRISKVAKKRSLDSYDGLGQYVSSTLRELPPRIALTAERDIQMTLFRCKQMAYQQESGSVDADFDESPVQAKEDVEESVAQAEEDDDQSLNIWQIEVKSDSE